MIKLFLDLDGTLAKFNSKRNALKRFDKEEDFFTNLKPFKNIEIINEISKLQNVKVFIVSASPNERANQDKMKWINKYLNEIDKANICLCSLGTNKANEIQKQLGITIDKECYLLDDYTNNLIEWTKANGIGIKRLTSLANNKSKRWQGLAIRDLKQLITLINNLQLDN